MLPLCAPSHDTRTWDAKRSIKDENESQTSVKAAGEKQKLRLNNLLRIVSGTRVRAIGYRDPEHGNTAILMRDVRPGCPGACGEAVATGGSGERELTAREDAHPYWAVNAWTKSSTLWTGLGAQVRGGGGGHNITGWSN